ncbi:MAG: lysozyme inhibitor LprI family protein [Nitratireductor sp.]
MKMKQTTTHDNASAATFGENSNSEYTTKINTRLAMLQGILIPTILCVAGILTFSSLPANSQTVSCATAGTTAEFTICNDEDLVVLDEQMGNILNVTLANQPTKPQRQAINKSQNLWNIRRTDCASNNQCLKDLYAGRIDELAATGPNLTAFSPE